jgi:hypothetical protein
MVKPFHYYKSKLDMALSYRDDTDYHKAESHQKCDSAIIELYNELKEIPQDEISYELNMLLIRVANSCGDNDVVLDILETIKEDGMNDPMWHYYMGNCFAFNDIESLNDNEKALFHFKIYLQFLAENKVQNVSAFEKIMIESYISELENKSATIA